MQCRKSLEPDNSKQGEALACATPVVMVGTHSQGGPVTPWPHVSGSEGAGVPSTIVHCGMTASKMSDRGPQRDTLWPFTQGKVNVNKIRPQTTWVNLKTRHWMKQGTNQRVLRDPICMDPKRSQRGKG